jgi:hypothetical protein
MVVPGTTASGLAKQGFAVPGIAMDEVPRKRLKEVEPLR